MFYIISTLKRIAPVLSLHDLNELNCMDILGHILYKSQIVPNLDQWSKTKYRGTNNRRANLNLSTKSWIWIYKQET